MENTFNEIYDEYYKRVFSYFFRKKISIDSAKDLTQETFFRVFNNMNKIRNVDSLQFWIFRIAHNTYCSMLKREKRRKESAMTTNSSEHIVEHSAVRSAEQILITKEVLDSIGKQVKEFPEMMRKCFVFHFYHELSYEQISQLLDVSANTIKTHIRRALKKIKNKE